MKNSIKFAVSLLVIFSITMLKGMEPDSVSIITNDGHTIQLTRKIFQNLKAASSLLGGYESTDTIPLPGISAELFIQVVDLLGLINDQDSFGKNLETLIESLQGNETPVAKYVELLNAANYLNFQELLQACVTVLAERVLKTLDPAKPIDPLLHWVTELDVPQELSVLLGQKILQRAGFYPFVVLPQAIKDFLKNEETTAFTYSPNRRFFACAIKGKGIYIWKTDPAELVHTITQENTVYSLAFSFDNTLLAVSSINPQGWDVMYVWDLKDQSPSKVNLSSDLRYAHIFSSSIAPDNKDIVINYTNDIISIRSLEDKHDAYELERRKFKNPLVYNQKGELVQKVINNYNRLIHTLYLHDSSKFNELSLRNELKKLGAEDALLFLWIFKNIIAGKKINLKNSKFQWVYSNLLRYKQISKLIKEFRETQKSSCWIS